MDHHNDENRYNQCNKTVYSTEYPAEKNRRELFKAIKWSLLCVVGLFVIIVDLLVGLSFIVVAIVD